jgi:hypothetical protein
VLDLLATETWTEARLRVPITRWAKKRREKTFAGKKQKYVKEWRAVDAVQFAYMRLYEARSKFLHGDRISERLLLPFKAAPTLPLLSIAPTVYWAALRSFLGANLPPREREINRWTGLGFLAQAEHERQLLRTLGHGSGDDED